MIDTLAAKIAAGLCLALAAALAIALWRADHWKGQAEEAREQVTQERTLHAVTRASITTLENELADVLARATAREQALEKLRKDAAAKDQQFDKLERRTDGQIANLERMARDARSECKASSELLRNLEGL